MTTTTNRDLEVGSLERRDVPEAVAVLARGMRDNPIHVAAFGPTQSGDGARSSDCSTVSSGS